MYPRRFSTAYVLLAFFFVALTAAAMLSLALGDVKVVKPESPHPKVIKNSSYPVDVERHFAKGLEYSQVPATAVDMRDGTCYVYTNEVSWLAMECFGTVK